MTENEKQIKLQQLKAEVTEKRNEINRRKDDLHAQLNNELSIGCDGMYNKKREMLKVINETRTEKSKYAYGSERREEMEEHRWPRLCGQQPPSSEKSGGGDQPPSPLPHGHLPH